MIEFIGAFVLFLFGSWVVATGLFCLFFGTKMTGNKEDVYVGVFLALCGGAVIVGILSMLEVSIK